MYYNKVEISCVDTSKLKVLSEKEKRELLTIIRTGSKAEAQKAREKMINGNFRKRSKQSTREDDKRQPAPCVVGYPAFCQSR